ncbi:transposase [Prevotella melaninogenica]|uniref:transposase n=1 Tax=Prevotella melaninogenica TaxID=28132 RepID=UPI0021D2D767|nr:transposase [Prevotella melaninogenica]
MQTYIKNRWQVELFFKWLKQHLKVKKFWGTTENAVRITNLFSNIGLLPGSYYPT